MFEYRFTTARTSTVGFPPGSAGVLIGSGTNADNR